MDDHFSGIETVIGLAHDYSIETRLRRLIESHTAAGTEPRTIVMNTETWHALCDELQGRSYTNGYWFAPKSGPISFFCGVPVLIKDFVANEEILIGV